MITFAMTFALCVVVGEVASRRLPILLAWRGDATIERPDPERFQVVSINSHLDHQVLYHDQGDVMTVAKRADVLLLGNSCINLAFSDEALRSIAERENVTFYNLGLGCDERVAFPLALIERFDLQPRVVIVNASRNFFGSDDSSLATRLMAERDYGSDAWQDCKEVSETSFGWNFRLAFHRYIPRFFAGKKRIEAGSIYRSRETGSWWWAAHQGPSPAHPLAAEVISDPLSDVERRNAMAFKRAMDARNVTIVLTQIPQRENCSQKLRELTTLLDAPVIVPKLDGLTTIDHMHLDAESAARFAGVFVEEFFACSEARVALDRDEQPSSRLAQSP